MEQQQPTDKTKALYDRLPIFSLIAAIISIISCCNPPQQLLFGVAAILTAWLSRQGRPLKGMALTGLILGILSVICSLLVFFQYMAAMQIIDDPANADLVREVMRQYQALFEQLEAQTQP
ncbi:MAG: hypothetical protein Q4F28_10630 [Eubacteriales bacterium]|nr:hypothetical protein [Eubacteriales bacterium]